MFFFFPSSLIFLSTFLICENQKKCSQDVCAKIKILVDVVERVEKSKRQVNSLAVPSPNPNRNSDISTNADLVSCYREILNLVGGLETDFKLKREVSKTCLDLAKNTKSLVSYLSEKGNLQRAGQIRSTLMTLINSARTYQKNYADVVLQKQIEKAQSEFVTSIKEAFSFNDKVLIDGDSKQQKTQNQQVVQPQQTQTNAQQTQSQQQAIQTPVAQLQQQGVTPVKLNPQQELANQIVTLLTNRFNSFKNEWEKVSDMSKRDIIEAITIQIVTSTAVTSETSLQSMNNQNASKIDDSSIKELKKFAEMKTATDDWDKSSNSVRKLNHANSNPSLLNVKAVTNENFKTQVTDCASSIGEDIIELLVSIYQTTNVAPSSKRTENTPESCVEKLKGDLKNIIDLSRAWIS